MIYKNILETIGKTPLIRLNRMNNTSCDILLKTEFFNPSSSIKDRASLYMIKDALSTGKINSETLIIEPTSGNTGIGLAMCCAVLGLKLTIVMPESMSIERRKMISGYGAKLVLTPKEKGMQGAVEEANRLANMVSNSFIPSQFSNPANIKAHIETTAKEIFEDSEGKVDIVIAGIGTSGSAVGISKGLKPLKNEVKVYGVEPAESPLLTKGVANSHKIQGIGANFVPELYDKNALDGILTVKGEDAILTARNLARMEGVMCGISSGANVKAALDVAKSLSNKTIVTIICDFGERYLSTELFDE